MFRIQRSANKNIVITLNKESAETGIVLDLRERVLADVTVAESLARYGAAGLTLENCPSYVCHLASRLRFRDRRRRLNRGGLGMTAATQQATDRLYNMVTTQASSLPSIDAYWMLAGVGGVMFVASFLLRPNETGKGESRSVH
jgi:hypothetical protein